MEVEGRDVRNNRKGERALREKNHENSEHFGVLDA